MRRIGLWVMTFAVVAGASAWAKGKSGSKAKARPEGVALKFGWPADLTANVTYQFTRKVTDQPAQAMSLAARMAVTAEGPLLRVGYHDWKAEPAASPSAGPLLSFEKMATIVDRKGAFVRVDGAVSTSDAQRLVAGMSAKAMDPEAQTKAARMIPALFQQNLTTTWQMLVGAWIGADLDIGADYESEEEGPIALLPGETIKSKFHVRAERFLACPGRPNARCVELKSRSEPDPKSMARVVELLGQKLGGTKGLGQADLAAVEESTLVTEPDRLIPHRLEIVKTIGSGRTRVDTTTWTFEYPTAPTGAPGK